MVLWERRNDLYLLEPQVQIQVTGYFFLGPQHKNQLNQTPPPNDPLNKILKDTHKYLAYSTEAKIYAI